MKTRETDERSFQIKLQGDTLKKIKMIADSEYRSITRQLIKIIDDFVEAKEAEPLEQ